MGKIVKIHNTHKQSTPLFVNGRAVEIPHNTDFPLAQSYVDALTDSRVNFTIVGDVAESKAAGYVKAEDAEEGLGGSASASATVQTPGADSPTHKPPTPTLVAVLPPAQVDQEPGGDNKVHAGSSTTGETRQLAEDAGLDEAKKRASLAAEGKTEPAVILTNNDPDQTGGGAAEAGNASAEQPGDNVEPDVLDGSIPKLVEYLDGVTDAAEIERLLKKEKGGKSRVGAVDALESRKAALAAE